MCCADGIRREARAFLRISRDPIVFVAHFAAVGVLAGRPIAPVQTGTMLDRRAVALLLACCSLFASAAIVEKQIGEREAQSSMVANFARAAACGVPPFAQRTCDLRIEGAGGDDVGADRLQAAAAATAAAPLPPATAHA